MSPPMGLQQRPLALSLCPGVNGYRLAFVGGTYFETIAEFPTWDEARAAREAAVVLGRLSS